MLPLIENSLALGGFNLLVGDGKQSIYRWRGGEIEQFMKLPKLVNSSSNILLQEKENSLERNFVEKNLVKNYRSQKQIIEFNNLFFSFLKQQIPENLQDIYDKHEQEFNPELNNGYAEIELFDVDDKDNEEIENAYNNLTLDKITYCIQLGFQYQDIAIIVRTNKHGNLLAEFLTKKGIPIISKESLLLKHSDEVNFLVNCFSLLIQPKNQITKIALAEFISNKKNIPFKFDKTTIEQLDKYILTNFSIIFTFHSLVNYCYFILCMRPLS